VSGRRVVSLLPAATDLVAALGLSADLVGRTHECDWPVAELAGVPVVTSTSLQPDDLSSREISAAVASSRTHTGSALYALDLDAFAAAAPEVVLTQELCEVCALSYGEVDRAVRAMQGSGPLVLSLQPATLTEVLALLPRVGAVLGVPEVAAQVLAALERRLDAVRASVAGRRTRRVVTVEWLDPCWPVGHWVPEQVEAAGGVDLLGEAGAHTVPTTWEAVHAADPEVLLLAPCGLAPERTLAELDAVPGLERFAEVWVLDGPAYFNRPGPRVVRGVEVLAQLLHGVGAPLRPGEAVRVR